MWIVWNVSVNNDNNNNSKMDYNSAAVIATILNAEKELLPVVALPYPALQTATTLFSWFFQQQGQEQQHDFQFFHATISMNEPAFDLQSSRCFRIDKDKKKQDEN